MPRKLAEIDRRKAHRFRIRPGLSIRAGDVVLAFDKAGENLTIIHRPDMACHLERFDIPADELEELLNKH